MEVYDKYDVSIYFYKNLILIYKFFNIKSIDELLNIFKSLNIKEIEKCNLTHKNILKYINIGLSDETISNNDNKIIFENNYKTKHPIFLTLQWVQGFEIPKNISKTFIKNYTLLKNYIKKEESFIIGKLYFEFYNKYNLIYQYRIPFTKYIVDLLIFPLNITVDNLFNFTNKNRFICIEIDENNHKNYNIDMEIDRNDILTLIGLKTIHINTSYYYINENIIINRIKNELNNNNCDDTNDNLSDVFFNKLTIIKNKKCKNNIFYNKYKEMNQTHIFL